MSASRIDKENAWGRRDSSACLLSLMTWVLAPGSTWWKVERTGSHKLCSDSHTGATAHVPHPHTSPLAEDLSLIVSTHMGQLTAIYESSSRASSILLCSPQAPTHTCYAHPRTKHTNRNNKNTPF